MTDSTAHDSLQLAHYAERAYLEYAMSVVKGRALPDVRDGQKPVQRRILYAMREMGLAHNSKPVKSARVVGEILGKYHPHGDSSAYEAMVRMAQDFTLRYPLIDGIGNFGSRDGDGAAAMRYTEARLTPVAQLLLSELDMGTADFVPNYDGAFEEPLCLPARLPMVLLNGASGIAVGMATEIPPHNLTEVAHAAIALLQQPELTTADLRQYLPAPDFAGGGHIISSDKDLQHIYETGKGSIRVRARYEIEKLARGQWRLIVRQLPPQTSAAKILAEIEELTNPKPKTGKKSLTQEQQNNRALMLSLLEKARDESDGEQPVRLVFEPKSGKIDPEVFIATLMAQTSLEGNQAVNLVMIGSDGRPTQKNLKTILQEWLDFRITTVTRRLRHRLNQVEKRIHILEGRQIALLHIDRVIAVIREADEPKQELMQAFGLTEIQAEDILEIRLRQLARLEAIRLETELQQLQEEAGYLKAVLGDENSKRLLVGQEIQEIVQQYGDARRTLVEQAERATLTRHTADEALTLIVSQKGWIRSRSGHNLDLSAIAFKEGDALQQIIECRSIEPVVVLDDNGRCYTLNPADIPGGRGDGIPLASLIDIQNNAQMVALLSAPMDALFLFAGSGAYGFAVRFAELTGRVKSGKEIIRLEENESPLFPIRLPEDLNGTLLLATQSARLLAFNVNEIKILAKGRGLQLMSLNEGDTLLQVACLPEHAQHFVVHSQGKRGGAHSETLRVADVAGKRGRKGRLLELAGTLTTLSAAKEGTS